jgi:hypothetical protein
VFWDTLATVRLKEAGSRAATCGKFPPGKDPASSSLIDHVRGNLNRARATPLTVDWRTVEA